MAINSSFRTLSADNMEGVVYARNYLKNSFENNSTTGWNKVSVSSMSGSVPASGSTISVGFASAVTTFAASATSPLNGKYSLNAASSAAWTAGQGFISDAFAIDRMDAGKVLTVSFDYELVSGTVNMSGTLGSQNFIVYIWDQTAGAWIQPAGFLGMNQSSGPGRVTCTFQSSVTAGQQYRVAVIASVATSGAVSLRFDNFTCSRQTAPIGPVVTDWVSYTPTGTWTTNTTYTGRWRRVGDTVEVDVGLALTGAPNATTLYVNYLPPGISIDTSKMSLAQQYIRSGYADGTQGGSAYNLKAIYDSPTRVLLAYQNQLNAIEIVVNATAPITWASGSTIHMRLSLPVAGWSSQVQLSNDTDTRVVAASYSRSTAQSISPATDTVIVYDTKRIDTHAAMNTSNGRFYAPVSGVYRITASVFYNFFTPVAGNPLQLRFRKRDVSGAVTEDLYKDNFTANAAVGQEIALRSAAQFYCNAGEQLEVVLWQNTSATRTTIAGINFVEIERLSGPSVVAASESVSAIYQTSAGQSIPHNSATVVVFGTKIFDSHSAMNASTGVFTCPVSGEYQLSAAFYFSTAITATATDIQTIAYKNGVAYLGVNNTKSGTAAAPLTTSGTIRIRCNAGDTLSCAVLQSNSATTAQTLLANAAFNWVAISRVGN